MYVVTMQLFWCKGNRANRIGGLTCLKGKKLVIMLLKYLRLWVRTWEVTAMLITSSNNNSGVFRDRL